MRHGIDHVSNYRTCGRKLACAPAVKHCLSEHIGINRNAVEYIRYTVKRIAFRNKPWGNHCKYPAVFELCVSYKLYGISCTFCCFYVISRYFCNPLNVQLSDGQHFPEGKRGKNNYLSCRIRTLDIGGRICLSIAFFLSFFKCGIKIRTAFRHLRKNIIGSSVQNAVNFLDMILRKIVYHRAYYRYSSTYACLKQICDAVFRRDMQKLRAEIRDDLLV